MGAFWFSLFMPIFALSGALPMVSLEQLTPGSAFTWSYFDANQGFSPYSTERYEVVDRNKWLITILMSTRLDFQAETNFRPTHLFRVDFRKCLEAHKDPRQKHNFLIDLYPATAEGSFSETSIPTAALPFEEKFNCHPQERKGRPDPYQTVYAQYATAWGERRLFQQKRTPSDQIVGFYFLDDPHLRGILYRKDFNPEAPNHYEMHLVDWHLGLRPSEQIRPVNQKKLQGQAH